MSRMSLLRWTRQSCIGASSVRVLGNGSGGARRCFHTPSSVDDFRTSIESNLKTALDRTKGTIFGLMANNMSESDVEKFVRHWGKRIDLHQEVDAKLSSQNKAVLPEKLPAKDDKRTASAPVIDKAMEKIAYATKKDLVLYHPLLGELVADLGYKRVYLTSVNALARTPVWERQRILRPERASLIADDKIRKGMNNALPGVITLYQLDSDDSIGIIDGQHRAGALMILAQRGHWEEHAKNVAVEVFSVGSEAQISTLFREINAAEPVRLIDLPEDTTTDDKEVDVATDEESREVEETSQPEEAVQSDERLIITHAVESLRQKYPEMFKPTSRCKLPHLNIDVLRDDLFSSGLLSNHKITSPAQLEDILERINKSLEAKYLAMVSTPKKRKALSKSTLNAISKATSQNFFLGMDKEWLFTSSPEDKA